MADDAFLLGQIVARLDAIDACLTSINDRLDASDKRFEEQGKRDAADGVVRSIALKVGTWVLGGVGMVGLAVLSHVPWIAEWLLPPKH